jgi:hypothetical protein
MGNTQPTDMKGSFSKASYLPVRDNKGLTDWALLTLHCVQSKGASNHER